MFTIKYSEMGSFQFQQALTKLVNAPISPAAAVIVSKLNKALKTARMQVAKEYLTDIRDVFATKDADGKIVEGEQGFEVEESKHADFKAATEAFGNRTIELTTSPLYFKYFEGAVKLSAEEIESINCLFTDTTDTGPATGPAMLRSV